MIRKFASTLRQGLPAVRLSSAVAAAAWLFCAAPASAGVVSTFGSGLTSYSGSGTTVVLSGGDQFITTGTGALQFESGAGLIIASGGRLTNEGGFNLVTGAQVANLGQIDTSGSFGIASGTAVSGNGVFQQSAGTTTVNGQMSQGSVNVNGGQLTGTGLISAASIGIGSGATVSPGGLRMNGTVAFDGLLSLNLNSAGQLGSLIVNGLLDFGDTARIQIDSNAVLTEASYDWVFATASAGILDFAPSLVTVADFAGYTETVTRECGVNNLCNLHLRVSLTPPVGVPEPASMALVALGLAGLGWSRGRPRAARVPAGG